MKQVPGSRDLKQPAEQSVLLSSFSIKNALKMSLKGLRQFDKSDV